MTPRLEILRAGPACTLQDAGRPGFQRFGVTPAGPMDWLSHGRANRAAGNPAGLVAIEAGPGGLSFAVAGAPVLLGIWAAGFRATLNGAAVPACAMLVCAPGDVVDLSPGAFGVWAYIAVAAGFDVAAVLGSRAVHLRSGLGPLQGRALRAGDRLAARARSGQARTVHALDDPAAPSPVLRFVPGPQDRAFTAQGFATFCAEPYAVTPQSDRMAYRLSGPAVPHARGHDIVSDGIPLGAIQIPGDGQPLVLMADRQPTGGYPKIGCVIRADLPALAQTRPGGRLRFRPVTVDEAVDALHRAAAGVLATG